MSMAKNEFALAFNEVLEEKQLSKDVVIFAQSSRRWFRPIGGLSTRPQHNMWKPKLTLKPVMSWSYAEKEVVEDNVVETTTEVLLEEARKVNPEAQLGDMVVVETTPATLAVLPHRPRVR